MDQDLDDKLIADFPHLYANRHEIMSVTSMCWGFACGNGWHEIIRNLSAKLEALILLLPEKSRRDCAAAQVKEKFGGLRFYMDSATDEMYALIREAESESFKTCEECGAPGVVRNKGYIRTLCDEHANKH